MLDVDGATGQSRHEVDLGVVEEVVVAAGEAGVGLLFDLENDIACEDAGSLVTLATELDLGAALDTTVDVDVQHLAVDNRLLAHALLAAILVLHNLTLAVAVRAHRLEALDHRAHLPHHRLHTVAVAGRAGPDSALLAAAALALGANDRPLQGELGHLTAIDVLERDVVDVVDRLGLGGTALVMHAAEHASEAASQTAAAEELGEEVFGRHARAGAGATLQTSFAILVVYLALLSIRQDFIGM